MSVPYRPILSAMLRNRTGPLLVAIQIAIALAVLVNAIYIVKQRVDRIGRPTGIDVENIFLVSSTGFARDFDYEASVGEDLRYLRNVPGVISASTMNAAPLSGSGGSTVLSPKPFDDSNPVYTYNYFMTDERGHDTLGLRLVAGRWFRADEVVPPSSTSQEIFAPQVVVTQATAKRLFPDGNALGKTVYSSNNQSAVIVGIVEHMLGSFLSRAHPEEAFFFPRVPVSARYLVRTEPGQRDRIMREVETGMSNLNRKRSVDYVRSLEYYKNRSYLTDRNMAIFLVVTTALLLAITCLGVFGLATFNVRTRTRQIGTRRAVGARRGDIVKQFLVENWMISTAGVAVGCVLALAAGHWIALEYRLPRVDLYYLVGGVIILWALGIAAAWQPARRAATISPATATRTT